ncbi:unnamed protein product [Phyllotreta striolata]|uniref:Sodium/calcium exchanger membrane region domain-containing protein n=1 Tax=Phyllotreta striolata TaxID=444603 RepID=A0A9N9TET3_PHYSR|nr:unnamed protein product [Phyllotreta striolata]
MMRSSLCLFILVCSYAATLVVAHPSRDKSNLTIDNKASENDHNSGVQKKYIREWNRLTFVPFAKLREGEDNSSCSAGDGDDDDFPFFLSEDQILHGGIILIVLIGIYGFTLLAVVCNDYFLPCVETICERLNLTPDVAAATFMSIATSTPEFFTNTIGTFVTNSDLGIGTIVGSSMFNALGVPAIGGLASARPLHLDWYPLSRDAFIYLIAISVLIYISYDGRIYWYETLISLSVYICYFIIMFNNKKIARFVKKFVKKLAKSEEGKDSQEEISKEPQEVEPDLPRASHISAYGTYSEENKTAEYEVEHQKVLEAVLSEDKKEAQQSLFRRPEGNMFQKIFFYYAWPLKLILRYTVPNPIVYPRFYPVTFLMCIFWIGVNSYVISWMISLIGLITHLPDALLGMTIMAVGGCLPETVSMTIIARRGEGAFGVSNSLGANTMNILYSLGLPWLLKNLIREGKVPIQIHSGSLEYTIMSLIVAVVVLYSILLIGKFRLSKISGAIIGCFYIALVVLAILTQTVFFKEQC